MRKYYKGILIPVLLVTGTIFAAAVDGGAEAGNYARKETAVVQTVVTLEDGNQYIVSEKETEVTVNTYNSSNPADWDIVY